MSIATAARRAVNGKPRRDRLAWSDVSELGRAGGWRFIQFAGDEYTVDSQPLSSVEVVQPLRENEIRVSTKATKFEFGTRLDYVETYRALLAPAGAFAKWAAKAPKGGATSHPRIVDAITRHQLFARVRERVIPLRVTGPDVQAAIEASPDVIGLPVPAERVRQAAVVTPPQAAASGMAELRARMAERGIELGTPVASGDIPISLKHNLSADEMTAARAAGRLLRGERCGFQHDDDAPVAIGLRLGIPDDIPACSAHSDANRS